jgi:sialidase-1
VHAYSSDGGATLDSQYEGIAEITAPGIQGSVLRVGDRLLLSTPVHPEIRRELTVFVSSDDGRSWRPGLVVHPGMAGYSDLVPLPGGQVGLFYEAGETSSFATLRFVTFNPGEIL